MLPTRTTGDLIDGHWKLLTNWNAVPRMLVWDNVSEYAWSLELGGHSAWAMLAPCPERWAELVAGPTLGAAVQHLLLDQAETHARDPCPGRRPDPAARCLPGEEDPGEELPAAEPGPALSEELLLACRPCTCPNWPTCGWPGSPNGCDEQIAGACR